MNKIREKQLTREKLKKYHIIHFDNNRLFYLDNIYHVLVVIRSKYYAVTASAGEFALKI